MAKKIPYIKEILADFETPLSAYWKLSQGESYSYLLESVTGGEQLARYSMIGTFPTKVIRSKNDQITVIEGGTPTKRTLDAGEDPLRVVRTEVAKLEAERQDGLPIFVGGAVGMIGYDYVRFIEKVQDTNPDDLMLDDIILMIVDTTIVFDHAKNLIKIVSLDDADEEGKARAFQRIEKVHGILKGPLPSLPTEKFAPPTFTSNMTQEQFESGVQMIIDYLGAGDGQQVVPSQRFSAPCEAPAINLYRALRTVNPSPYMFLLKMDETTLVGASPELLVSLHNGIATLRPIAGTRWRSADPVEDKRLGEEMLADEKERAEHVMLVDLGRNDLGRVCKYGTVKVNDLMIVERYSHVMHIVSEVAGQLNDDQDAFDLMRACFPAGTVSGSPKVRAIQIIDEVEVSRRGAYAGAVGFFSATGDLDTCISIRTIVLKDGFAHVQAGAGVVFDSIPKNEWEETKNKARAAIKAIELAHLGLD